jgi:hypothetical protein
LNINLNINNVRQDCKIGTVCGRGVLMGGMRVNEGDKGEGIWQMDFIYKPLAIALSGIGRRLSGGDDWDDLTNVQYKPNRNCHHETPHNEYILIKKFIIKKKSTYSQ